MQGRSSDSSLLKRLPDFPNQWPKSSSNLSFKDRDLQQRELLPNFTAFPFNFLLQPQGAKSKTIAAAKIYFFFKKSRFSHLFCQHNNFPIAESETLYRLRAIRQQQTKKNGDDVDHLLSTPTSFPFILFFKGKRIKSLMLRFRQIPSDMP